MATTQKRNVYQAIAEVQAELAKEGISKDRPNQEQRYMFRGIDQVYNALAPKLAAAKLSILPFVEDRVEREYTTKRGTQMLHVTLRVRYDMICAEDPSTVHQLQVFGEGTDTGDKASNKALSAAYKYAVIQAFAIPVEGQDDADATTPEERAAPAKAAPPPPNVDSSTGEIVTISAEDAKNVQMAVKNAGIQEAPFFKWLKVPKGKYDQIPQAKLAKVQERLMEKLAEAKKTEEAKTADDLDDDIPF